MKWDELLLSTCFGAFTSSPLSFVGERALLAAIIGAFEAYVYAFNLFSHTQY